MLQVLCLLFRIAKKKGGSSDGNSNKGDNGNKGYNGNKGGNSGRDKK